MKLSRSCLFASAILVSSFMVFAAATPAVAASSSAIASQRGALPPQSGNFALRNLPTVGTDHVRCLGIGSSGNAVIWDCTYENDQSWHFGNEYGDTGYNQLINAKGQCLGIEGGSNEQGKPVVGATCEPTHKDQYWTFDNTGATGDFWIFNLYSPYVVGVKGGSTANSAAVIMWAWQDKSNNQAWEYSFISDRHVS
jgi:hypothetical protein